MKNSKKIENKILCLLGALNLPKESKRNYMYGVIDTYESEHIINEQTAKELREIVNEVVDE